jgi:hypothetical protein
MTPRQAIAFVRRHGVVLEGVGPRSFAGAVLTATVTALSASLSAQWPLYPASGVQKGPDGTPDLMAPVPRTADGRRGSASVGLKLKRSSTVMFVR